MTSFDVTLVQPTLQALRALLPQSGTARFPYPSVPISGSNFNAPLIRRGERRQLEAAVHGRDRITTLLDYTVKAQGYVSCMVGVFELHEQKKGPLRR
jgi:hypothetical protein